MAETEPVLFTIAEAGEILGLKTEGDPGFHRASVNGVSTDSRTVKKSELFVAIRGENHDGHDFLDEAFAKSAVAAVVARSEARRRDLVGPRYIIVDDTLHALGELARHYRRKMPAKIIAVTGSNGKTTVKNMIYEVLSRQGPALKSPGNFNNLVGLPISIFSLRREHRRAVFELGMSAKGEIARLSEIASPEIAVITNVGPVHLEFLKTIEAIAEAKLELISNIRANGILVVNGDDLILNRKLRRVNVRVIRFGLNSGNDIYPTDLEYDESQMSRFRIGNTQFNLQLPGVPNVYNALAAFAVSVAAGTPAEQASSAISSFRAEAMRSEVVRKGGVTLLIDCYNANPVSMKYALQTLAKTHCDGRRIAVLADMLELGDDGKAYHEEIGELAHSLKIDRVFAFGSLSKEIVGHFGKGGIHFENKADLAHELVKSTGPGDVVLFKGSRGMALEEVVEELKKKI